MSDSCVIVNCLLKTFPKLLAKDQHICVNALSRLHRHHSPVFNSIHVEVNKPAEGILVHRIYVGQISNGEEQGGGLFGNGSVTLSRLCNTDLCLLCNLGKT